MYIISTGVYIYMCITYTGVYIYVYYTYWSRILYILEHIYIHVKRVTWQPYPLVDVQTNTHTHTHTINSGGNGGSTHVFGGDSLFIFTAGPFTPHASSISVDRGAGACGRTPTAARSQGSVCQRTRLVPRD